MAQKKLNTGKDFITEVGKNILRIRKKRGLSLNSLGLAIGSDKMEISKIQKGKNITILTLLKISIALKVSPSEILKSSHEYNDEDLDNLVSSNKANRTKRNINLKSKESKEDLISVTLKLANNVSNKIKEVDEIGKKFKIKR